MSSEIAIKVEKLSKSYQIYDKPHDRLKQMLYPRFQRLAGRNPAQYYREFVALKDVSFEIRRGETVGIIGRNGSGKSTLLQMICGTLNPSGGTIHTNGRIAALLELGSGFNPEFTGRENVYLNAAVLGLSKDEIESRLEDILSFADIGEFIEQPVKTYSSGMAVRLAFAVSASIDPDILVVDEALSVGDAKFQAKCFDRLRRLKENGTSILLVTHSSDQIVAHCNQAILLNSGVQVEAGEPRRVVNRYLDLLFGKEAKDLGQAGQRTAGAASSSAPNMEFDLSLTADQFCNHPNYNPHEYRWGDGTASMLDFYVGADGQAYPTAVHTGQKIVLAVSSVFNQNIHRPVFGITIKTKEGVSIYGVNSETLECQGAQSLGTAGTLAILRAEFTCRLAPGDYFISLGIASRHGEEIIPHDRRYDSVHLHVMPNNSFFGLCDLDLHMSAMEYSE